MLKAPEYQDTRDFTAIDELEEDEELRNMAPISMEQIIAENNKQMYRWDNIPD